MSDTAKYAEKKLDRLNTKQRLTAIEKSRKLKSLHVTKNKLDTARQQKAKQIREIEGDIHGIDTQIVLVEKELEELNADTSSPIVTEHAYLRYIERFMGVDLNKIHEEILALPEKDTVRHGRTIVTVFTDKEDHFNLAEREAE